MEYLRVPRVRKDAVQNRDALIEAAMAVLIESPRAGIREIAAVASVSRSTFYNHFSARSALIGAVVRRAVSATAARFAGFPLASDDIVAPFDMTTWRALDIVATIALHSGPLPGSDNATSLHEHQIEQLRQYLRRGRADGRIRADHDVRWQIECIYAIARAGGTLSTTQSHYPPASAAEMAATLRAVLAASPVVSETEGSTPHRRPADPL